LARRICFSVLVKFVIFYGVVQFLNIALGFDPVLELLDQLLEFGQALLQSLSEMPLPDQHSPQLRRLKVVPCQGQRQPSKVVSGARDVQVPGGFRGKNQEQPLGRPPL
jgi:hypothetical protein